LAAPKEIADLVERFENNKESHKSGHYNEVQGGDLMLSLHKQLQEARTPHEQTALPRQIEATDRQIDALVYELYGLTKEENGIVEGRE
jgi:adenine-specific DNA-methyltransferase